MQDFEAMMRKGGGAAIAEAGRFFMEIDPVHRTLRTITSRLDTLAIPYAVAGGMALVAHGYERTTVDVDLLITAEALDALRSKLEGLGYVSPVADSKNLRDTSTGVQIKFLICGQYPGDGKPKPIAFSDPAAVSVEIDGVRYVRLPTLVELKLASGMTAPHRLKDLADVQELIKVLGLARSFGDSLNPFVRDKFVELWEAVHNSQEPLP